MRSSLWLIVVYCLAVLPIAANGQAAVTTTLSAGTRVRVTMDGKRGAQHVGAVLAGAGDSLILLDEMPSGARGMDSKPARASLPVANIRSIEISDGRATGTWIVGGALVGAAGFAGAAYIAASRDAKRQIQGPFQAAGSRLVGRVVALGAAAVGAGVGALVGGLAAPERWRTPTTAR